MSLSMILIPAALAVAAAVGGTGVAGAASLRKTTSDSPGTGGATRESDATVHELSVQTRMKDPVLLGAALQDLGALRVTVEEERIVGVLDGIRLEMIRDADGVWTAHFAAQDGREVSTEEGTDIVAHLDAAYARRVQQAVAERIRQNADGAGFDLVSETREADDTVTMVLNVREYVS